MKNNTLMKKIDRILVLAVGDSGGSRELLQRRIGGILKGIATVETAALENIDDFPDAKIIASHIHGFSHRDLLQNKKLRSKRIIGIEMTLLPVGIKTIRMLDPNLRFGVVAEHRGCVNYFFSEVVRAGIVNYHLTLGTFSEMEHMKVDKFILSEESLELMSKYNVPHDKIIPMPRTIAPQSAAELIHAALEVGKD